MLYALGDDRRIRRGRRSSKASSGIVHDVEIKTHVHPHTETIFDQFVKP